MPTFNNIASGGVVSGSSATARHVCRNNGSGGVVAGSSATVSELNAASGCSCNVFNVLASGGVVCSGAALKDSHIRIASGGAVCGGSAIVANVGDVTDGLYYWPLDDGPEYEELSRYGLDGSSDNPPTLDDGPWCLGSQSFVGDDLEYITLPQDNLSPSYGFTVSMWVRLNGARWEQRTLYSRGASSFDWQLRLEYGYLQHLIASVQSGDALFEAWSANPISVDRWHFVGITWTPNGSLTLHVDGSSVGSVATPVSSLDSLTTDSYLGRFAQGSFATANLMNVIVDSQARESAYLASMYNNFCDTGFYALSGPSSPIYG